LAELLGKVPPEMLTFSSISESLGMKILATFGKILCLRRRQGRKQQTELVYIGFWRL
jgi:hypothetical protein